MWEGAVIGTADWHIRRDVPRCRNQSEKEWIDWQLHIVETIARKVHEDDGRLLIAGDIFHRPTVDTWLLNSVSDLLSGISVTCMPGNHDLKDGNPDTTGTAYGSFVRQIDAVNHFDILPWGAMEEDAIIRNGVNSKVLLVHCLTEENPGDIHSGAHAITAKTLLSMFDHDIILVGDNHTPFMYGKKRKVINCGSITTQSTAEHREKYIWNLETLERIVLPEDPCEIVEDSYTATKIEKDSRFASFLSLASDSSGETLDYEEELRRALQDKSVDPKVRSMIESVLGDTYE